MEVERQTTNLRVGRSNRSGRAIFPNNHSLSTIGPKPGGCGERGAHGRGHRTTGFDARHSPLSQAGRDRDCAARYVRPWQGGIATRAKIIIFAWVNDRDSLRTYGSKSDAYAVFKAMLDKGNPPDDWEALVTGSTAISSD